jgi:N12 class adenine-specific DNA methylase/SAM-dependent methyltransferase
MTTKRRSQQPTLPGFVNDFADVAPNPEAADALPDDHAGTAASEPETARGTPAETGPTGDGASTRRGAENAASGVDSPASGTVAGSGLGVAAFAGSGTGSRGIGGSSFVERVGGRRIPAQHTARLKPRRPQPSLFDVVPEATDDEVVELFPQASKASGTTASLFENAVEEPAAAVAPAFSSGEKGKARDVLAAIRTLHRIEGERRPATVKEQAILARFPGFGPLARHLFPDPVTGTYADAGWQTLGDELKALLTLDEYASAKRTTFNAFYTSPVVIQAIHDALPKLGVPVNGHVLEPGCGTGNFLAMAPASLHFTGVELDSISGRIAKARHPQHDIRIEDFRDTKLPQNLDAVVGNVPFADVRYDYHGQKLALHDYFLAKSLDALAPGSIAAVVSSHYTLDKQNAAAREVLAERADFLGAIRLPSDAFKTEGTAVVTDILFLRKRAKGEPVQHSDSAWLTTRPLDIDSVSLPINGYFLNHPEMILGSWSRQDTLYGNGYSVKSNGDLATQLRIATSRLPTFTHRTRTASIPSNASTSFEPQPDTIAPATEGSFAVGEDRRIRQSVDGQWLPVVYGGQELTAFGSLVGRRMASLLGLRDKARRVLQSQNEGWPEVARDEARGQLNHDYDRFVHQFGSINKTTFSETKDGTVIRRMPNLVKFREDPDAMLVMALEEYDETTGQAGKAPILRHDVVGRTPPVTHVRSASDGLLASLDQKGCIDLPFIARLYGKDESQVIAELGELIFENPLTKQWETADAYLSGNVRVKLSQAEAAGTAFARNTAALRAVQPEDVLPGDIDANLGAPWIPASDVQAFAGDLFRVSPDSVTLAHLPKDAVWSVEPNWSASQSVAATTEFGTDRISGFALLEQALNLKTPTIYDTMQVSGGEQRVLNPEATLAAREKQKLIKERFHAWIFSDPDRTERLVRTYNDTYNSLRPRQFDGSHLVFPGLSQGITLRPHQTNAIWRGMCGGNTLLAHCVGAGKTFTMAATGMKMKQAGLIRKPMYVVPNHLLEQFGREFLQLYPNAKLLIADKEDFTREKRKFLTAKMASGEWDGIIVTHSSFEKIGLSLEYQAKFLREQIAEYDQLLVDRACRNPSKAHRNIIKTIEKQKARQEAKLKELLAADKKDDGLTFEDLGVDHLFVDESHLHKNLETATKMDRVAGIQTGGSERAFDLFMKCRYLDERHAGHGVTFATGTPVSNTMVELYTLSRYLDPAGLKARGIDHFDAWAATFGEVVDAMEISPDGSSLRPRSRFAKFVNLPELQQMFRSFADVQTAEMLNLPRPALQGGKAQVIACPMSDAQARMQESLVARYEKVRSSKVDPREDNALAITTDGRKLALDARMVSPEAKDSPDSKVNSLVANVHRIWQETTATKGTQMIFSDLGVHPTKWGFSVYGDIIGKLVQAGVPRSQIAAIGEADSDAKKQALFEQVRKGSVRILLGSTQKMGAGTNVQKRLVALHHLDAPWKPAEVEQREGRILRQGNANAEVAIYRYVTERSFDSYLWQTLETKAKFISQLMTGETGVRKAEDVGSQEMSFAEVKAIASGNPAVLTLAEADAEIARLSVLRRGHADEQFLARRAIRELPEKIERLQKEHRALQADVATLTQHEGEGLKLRGVSVPADQLQSMLGATLERLPEDVSHTRRFTLGTFKGLEFAIERHPGGATDVVLLGQAERGWTLAKDSLGPRAVMNALQRLVPSYAERIERVEADIEIARTQLRDFESRASIPFVHAARLNQLTTLRDQLQLALAVPNGTPEANEASSAKSVELSSQIRGLLAAKDTDDPGRRRGWAARTDASRQPATERVHG